MLLRDCQVAIGLILFRMGIDFAYILNNAYL